MKKTKLIGAALSAAAVCLLAAGCNSGVFASLDSIGSVKPAVSTEIVSQDMFNPGKSPSLWYGVALNKTTGTTTTAIMKIEPLPVGTSTVIDGYIEFGFIMDTGNIKSNTGLLGSYKLAVENDTTTMSIQWGGDYKTESSIKMFDLVVKSVARQALLTGEKDTQFEDLTLIFNPVAIGSNAFSTDDLTKGFLRATGINMTNFILSLQKDGSFSWGGKINGFRIPNGKWEVNDKGDFTLMVTVKNDKGEDEDVVINRVAGKTIGDGTPDSAEKWGHGSIAVEKCLWIAFDSADLKKIGYTGEAFSNLPLIFSANTIPVTK